MSVLGRFNNACRVRWSLKWRVFWTDTRVWKRYQRIFRWRLIEEILVSPELLPTLTILSGERSSHLYHDWKIDETTRPE